MICDNIFLNRTELTRHLDKSHASTQDLTSCTICSKAYPSSGALEHHYRLEHQTPPLEYSFHQNQLFTSQADNQLSDSPSCYGCDLCGNAFLNQDNLKAHLTLGHDGGLYPLRYRCESNHCEESWYYDSPGVGGEDRQPNRVDESENRHFNTGVEDTSKCFCYKCDKLFSTYDNLAAHTKTCHPPEAPQTCDQCETSSLTQSSLAEHNESTHSTIPQFDGNVTLDDLSEAESNCVTRMSVNVENAPNV